MRSAEFRLHCPQRTLLSAALLPSTSGPAAKQPSSLEKPTLRPSPEAPVAGKGGRAELLHRQRPEMRSTGEGRLFPGRRARSSVTAHCTGSPSRTAVSKRWRIERTPRVNFHLIVATIDAPPSNERSCTHSSCGAAAHVVQKNGVPAPTHRPAGPKGRSSAHAEEDVIAKRV